MILAFTTSAESAVQPSETAVQLEQAFISVAQEVGPTVVSISAVHTERVRGYYFSPFEDEFTQRFFQDFFGEVPYREFKRIGLGSGFIIDPEGYILTNEHVVGDADEIHVTLADGREFHAEVKGRDPRSDLAVVKIPAKGLPIAALGDSNEVKIGQWSIAIGNPFGFALTNPEPTVTVGVISAMNRTLPRTSSREKDFMDLIQTDAAINPGNSGGPLVSLKGEVIGINVAIFTTSGGYQGIGFAIPINQAKRIIQDLIEGKKILYGWLGVNIQDLNAELAAHFGAPDSKGVLVAKVLEGGPADVGGIKEGDILLNFDGKKIENVRDLIRQINQIPVGQTIQVKIWRQGKESALKMKVGERPEDIYSLDLLKKPSGFSGDSVQMWRGLQVQELTSSLAARLGLEETQGVIVTQVETDSPAYRAGLRVGDVIFELNRITIQNPKEFTQVTSQITDSALIRTQRGYVVIKAE